MPILQWLTRETDVRAAAKVPFRVLEEDASLGYGEVDTENMLIQGDNLDALKSLLPYYAGQVKCIYIDPPYNTGHAFEQYDDNVEHSQWLSLMYPRLELLRSFLSEDGSIWISIDDEEGHYLKIVCDEIFGRDNFVNTVVWEKKYTISNDTRYLSDNHDFVLAYAKNKKIWTPRPLPRTENMDKAYKNPDNHPKGVWKATPLHAKSGTEQMAHFSYTFKNGVTFTPPAGCFSRYSKETLRKMDEGNEIWFGKNGNSIPQRKTFLCDLKRQGTPSKTLWRFDEVGHNHEAREEVKIFNAESVFSTPKPERLIQRILFLSSNPGDLVMDSFLGSGTTAAVAHKMGRQYIGIELGEHCITHCRPRLVKVVDGEQGGISKTVGWQGGGGFRFYRLGEPFFNEKGLISRDVSYKNLAAHIWFSETYKPMPQKEPTGAFLGVHGNTAYVVLHHDICGTDDLTSVVYRKLRREIDAEAPGVEKVVIYGESCRMGQEKLRMAGVIFKQIPYDVKGH